MTNTVTLELTYEEDHWKIAPSFELVNAIFGGMYGSLPGLGAGSGLSPSGPRSCEASGPAFFPVWEKGRPFLTLYRIGRHPPTL